MLSCVCLDAEDERKKTDPLLKTASSDTVTTSLPSLSSSHSTLQAAPVGSPASQGVDASPAEERKPRKKFRDRITIFTGALGSRDDYDMYDEEEEQSDDDDFEYQADSLFDSESRKFDWKWPKDFEPLDSVINDDDKLDKITKVQHELGTSKKNYMLLAKRTKFPLDKSTIVRYLEAHQWKVDNVAANIIETIEWRLSMGLPSFDKALLKTELETGKFFCHGKARDGRPVVYLMLGRENTWSADGNTAAVVYTLERAISTMKKQVQESIYIIDCEGVGVTTAPSTAFVSQLIGVLGKHYPRRMGQIFICNVSSVFYFIWNVVSLTLAEMSAKKIQILTSDINEMRTRIGEYVHPDNLHVRFGGEADFTFDVNSYLRSDKALL